MIQQKAYRVLIADDHEVVRSGVRALLEAQLGVEVCGEAANGAETMELVRTGKPDLVLLDLMMPETDGLEMIRTIRGISPECAVLVFSIHASELIAREVLRAGACGYVLKSDANNELLVAINLLRQGKTYVSAGLRASARGDFGNGANLNAERLMEETLLTRRELEICQLLAEGSSNKQIASKLGISTRTVESHRAHIMHKMNVSSFSELIRFAIRNNLVTG
jgi:DNA-binding NarL/FixJ family response regulator